MRRSTSCALAWMQEAVLDEQAAVSALRGKAVGHCQTTVGASLSSPRWSSGSRPLNQVSRRSDFEARGAVAVAMPEVACVGR